MHRCLLIRLIKNKREVRKMKVGARVTYKKLVREAVPPEGTITEVINARGVMVQWDKSDSFPLCANGALRLELKRDLTEIITFG
jgi:hypothetical protein